MLTADGLRLPGFRREDAVRISGDSLRHAVRWQSKSWANLPAGTYMLRLHLENAEVFAITVESAK
ncbi:MAG TPA: hypothetical protein VM186_14425 [Planctomycetota bacterium]|nr:hypothetical protein [Planctomycetota bacterium]